MRPSASSFASLVCFRLAFSTNQKSKPWEKERTGRVIDDIHLSSVKTRRQRAEWQVQLKDAGLAVAGIYLRQLDKGAFEYVSFTSEESDVRE